MKEIYKITKDYPKEEKFGIISQIRRASISIVANIVEATKRKTIKDRTNFYNISNGSLEETKYYLFLSYELGFINKGIFQKLLNQSREIGAMLNGLINSINK